MNLLKKIFKKKLKLTEQQKKDFEKATTHGRLATDQREKNRYFKSYSKNKLLIAVMQLVYFNDKVDACLDEKKKREGGMFKHVLDIDLDD